MFLLSGIAALLNVFASRLARVADKLDVICAEVRQGVNTPDMLRQLAYLRHRSHILDTAVVVGSLGGVATCAAALFLFVGALRDSSAASVEFSWFGAGMACTMLALGAFMWEMLVASRGLRAQITQERAQASKRAGSKPPGHTKSG